MRAALVVVVLAACGGNAAPVSNPIGNQVTLPAMPSVGDPAAVVDPTRLSHPPAIVFVDANGAVALGRTGKAWKGVLPSDRRPLSAADVVALRSVVKAAYDDDLGISRRPSSGQDDPPPPEEEDLPEDGEGTAMSLEEGKMGKQDSDRAEGQYKMRKHEDPQLARQQAIDQARAAGLLGPGRMGALASRQVSDLTASPVFVVAPGTTAGRVVELIRAAGGGAIAVVHDQQVRLLVHGFKATRAGITEGFMDHSTTVDLHLDGTGVRVVDRGTERVAIAWARFDRATLSDAFHQASGQQTHVDILVDPQGVTTQHLVDTLAAFPRSTVSLDLLEHRQKSRLPTVSIGQPTATGDLDKAIIRRYIKRNLGKIQYCYEKLLVAKPHIMGSVTAQFFIEPTGKVGTSTASGLDPDVASCVADVIKVIEFPKPKGGGGVQVNYPFVFRPQD